MPQYDLRDDAGDKKPGGHILAAYGKSTDPPGTRRTRERNTTKVLTTPLDEGEGHHVAAGDVADLVTENRFHLHSVQAD